MANAIAKIAAASSGPRQLTTTPSPGRLSNMVEELPLILPVYGHLLGRQRMKPVPNAIELSQAAAKLVRNFRPRRHRRLRTATPAAGKLIQIFTIRAISANGKPFALG